MPQANNKIDSNGLVNAQDVFDYSCKVSLFKVELQTLSYGFLLALL
jgi:hypothetical protein